MGLHHDDAILGHSPFSLVFWPVIGPIRQSAIVHFPDSALTVSNFHFARQQRWAAMRAAVVVLLRVCVALATASALTTGAYFKTDADADSVRARESTPDAAAEGRSSTRDSGDWDHCKTFSETVAYGYPVNVIPTPSCYTMSANPFYILKYSIVPSSAFPYTVNIGDEECPSANNNVMSFETDTYSNGGSSTREKEIEAGFSSYSPKVGIYCLAFPRCSFTGEVCFKALEPIPDDDLSTNNWNSPFDSGMAFPPEMIAVVVVAVLVFFIMISVGIWAFCRRRRLMGASVVGHSSTRRRVTQHRAIRRKDTRHRAIRHRDTRRRAIRRRATRRVPRRRTSRRRTTRRRTMRRRTT